MLPSKSIDTSDEEDGYPRRAAVFQGGDEVQLSIYRDRKKHWWLVYEYEYQPIGKKALDVRELLRFALLRMNASAVDELQAKLSWDRFFGIELIETMAAYCARHVAAGGRLAHVTRHMVGLFHGLPGARRYRQILSTEATRAGAGPDVLLRALDAVEPLLAVA